MSVPYRSINGLVAAILLAAYAYSHASLAADVMAPARFSGTATLSAEPPPSSDGRFRLNAALSVSVQRSEGQRYSMSAKLKPDRKSGNGICGPSGNSLFRNGFE